MKTSFSTEAARLEASSDGAIAVIITIMVRELHPPHGTDLASLREILPTFSAYIMGFIFVGIYWNNHHHILRASSGIDGRAMWANLHLLAGFRSRRSQRRGSERTRLRSCRPHSMPRSCS